mgnify:CR=1 FL=1
MRKQTLIDCCIVLLIAGVGLVVTGAARQTPAAPTDRWLAFDVLIDPHGRPLAAYQVDLIAPPAARILGVEGGDGRAFNAAPYYDPQALPHNRIILAAYSLDQALPSHRTRVARLHLHIAGGGAAGAGGALTFAAKVVVAVDPAGQPLAASVQVQETP